MADHPLTFFGGGNLCQSVVVPLAVPIDRLVGLFRHRRTIINISHTDNIYSSYICSNVCLMTLHQAS